MSMLEMMDITMAELRHLEDRLGFSEYQTDQIYCARLQSAARIYAANKIQGALEEYLKHE